MPLKISAIRLLASAAVATVLGLSVGGCSNIGGRDTTGSIGQAGAVAGAGTDSRKSLDAMAAHYRDNPGDTNAAIAYASALRATDQRAQAVAVLEQASIRNPNSMPLLGAYGRALADAGQYQQALVALDHAHTPDAPDWRILNVKGAVLDQMGRHADAQRHYASALKIVPDEPSVLSNLGLSYVLSKDLPKAEEILRRAYAGGKADARVRQNLGLVVGLQGRFAEAETIVKADLPADEAAANVAYLKEMLNRKDGPRIGAPATIPVASANRPN